MRIRLSNKFYTKEAIEKSIEAFRDVCECNFVDDSFEIELIPKAGNDSELGLEFCNFVLGVTKDSLLF